MTSKLLQNDIEHNFRVRYSIKNGRLESNCSQVYLVLKVLMEDEPWIQACAINNAGRVNCEPEPNLRNSAPKAKSKKTGGKLPSCFMSVINPVGYDRPEPLYVQKT